MMLAFAVLAALPPAEAADIEPQALPDGIADSGINVLLDSSHEFSFFHHWQIQDTLRAAGHRVTGNQASLNYALTPGTPMRVRKQDDHTWLLDRPMVELPAPEFDVVLTYQNGKEHQPYLPEEREALTQFVEQGGGLVIHCWHHESPLADVAASFGSRLLPDKADVGAAEDIPGLDSYDLPTDFNVAEFSDAWETVVVGDGVGSLAWRRLGKGVVVCVAAFELFAVTADQVTQPNADLLDWAITTAAGGHRERHDERRLPWEPSGIGGAFYPENEIEVGGVKVLYADNQLPDIVELAKTRFTEVRDLLQEMLPTPPSPGEAFYIDLAGGEGGGWAENAYTPRLAGTAATDHDAILSILGHELAHTMYGPAAIDGTAGCVLPGWFSEAHAGWFQRKLMGKLGTGPSGPHVEQYLAQHDPLLNDVDLADVPPEKYVVAWTKVWLLWAILDGRYGEDWYAKWLEYLHNKYNDPKREVSMDEYIMSISESVGEDVAPLFERFGTTVGDRTDLRPIGPPE